MTILASDLPKYPASGGGTRIKLENEAGDLRRRDDSLSDAVNDTAEAVSAYLETAEKFAANANRIAAAAKAARSRR